MLLGPPALPPDPPAAVHEEPSSDPLQIDWDAPVGCSSSAQLREHIGRYLAEVPSDPLMVTASAQREGQAWRLSLRLERPGHTMVRELEAPSCELLSKAAALVVAVHVDVIGASKGVRELTTAPEDFVTPTAEPPPELEPPTSTAANINDAPPPTTVETRTRRPPDRLARRRPPAPRPARAGILRLVANGGTGERPGVFGGVGLVGGFGWSNVRLEGQFDYVVPRDLVQSQEDQVTASFQGLIGTVRGCWVSSYERFEFPLCGGFRAGGLRGIARGVENPQAGWSSWIGFAAEPAVVWSPVPELGLFAGLGVLVGLRRPSFRVGLDRDPLFTSAPLALQLSLGIEVKLF